ncbi:GntR family transcriptional regulator [Pedobacter antarcticus]|uniref:Transcriptional regulator n=2 Tax=Pedobacter antarcticus TaxID=34086 RepID=A0A081PBM1_9SPHI|nr:GntR family transcriptional regulator [Pedobacter antarcticus]KEQ28094.1 transcriptional regulator [Pedobacter antarcticus 4BY]SDL43111.1 DNA-binding transcriptional regulator, GntR family [Pedobacter antarcticus]SFE41716.1 DNA-binding transcriptional regulator, GntR family [Pedobacter antarcticus]
MKPVDYFKFIKVDDYSATPKYLQLSDSIIEAVEQGLLLKNDILPSINELSCVLEISRDTAEKGYKYLKNKGVIVSVPGKGYYIDQTDFKKKVKIFLLFNKLSVHKKMIYDSFVSALGEDATIDFYIYNNNFALFKKLIQNKRTVYTHYVIIPHFVEGGEMAHEIINTIPPEKLILLDKKIPGITGEYSAVYEDFEKDIYNALGEARDALAKYHTLKIVFPKHSYFPKEIINGFRRFCQQYAFNHAIVHEMKNEKITAGEAYIILVEDDLVVLMENVLAWDLTVGKEVGIISYNETPLKKFLLNGITTISTDFKMMGTMAAAIALGHSVQSYAAPFKLQLRKSL